MHRDERRRHALIGTPSPLDSGRSARGGRPGCWGSGVEAHDLCGGGMSFPSLRKVRSFWARKMRHSRRILGGGGGGNARFGPQSTCKRSSILEKAAGKSRRGRAGGGGRSGVCVAKSQCCVCCGFLHVSNLGNENYCRGTSLIRNKKSPTPRGHPRVLGIGYTAWS